MDEVSPVTVLDEEESWQRLASASIGRLAVSVAGRPDIFPINYVVDGRSLVIRTNPGDKLVELTINDQIAVEVDEHTATQAWSVVLHGTAQQLEHGADIAIAEQLALTTLVPISTAVFVRITPTSIHGRSFDLTLARPEPE